MGKFGRGILIVGLTLVAAGCAPAPKPVVVHKPVAPPPAPAIPPMPLPPGGAAVTMKVPPLGTDGVRTTPNRSLTREENIWHLRSGLNVAALNCQGPVWGEIAQNYNRFLQVHKSRLAQSNKSVDSEYVKRFPGQNGLRVRDTRMTDLYNYFALPPVRAEFCDKSLAKSREIVNLPSTALPEYSFGALADLDAVFINFFNAFEQYKVDIVEWNARYGPQPVAQAYAPVSVSSATTK
ncbi:MAG: hypothetical protein IPM67_04585 [Sphingomonadales bacterium]|jgi:hypothetical protein|nr:hypothetical protein [Sphingomonadales bacterium]